MFISAELHKQSIEQCRVRACCLGVHVVQSLELTRLHDQICISNVSLNCRDFCLLNECINEGDIFVFISMLCCKCVSFIGRYK